MKLIFISGGVRSGKSALGERLVLEGFGRKIYLATSEIYDEEMEARIARHRQDRAGKGFVTLERSRNVASALPELLPDDSVLLDCLGTLLANEMFSGGLPSQEKPEVLAHRIYEEITCINAAVSLLVVISNEVFSDGVRYEAETEQYLAALGLLHRLLAADSQEAYECVSGVPVQHKQARR